MEGRNFTVGVVVSTYNNPAWLEKALWGYLCQDVPADEVVVADDGSTGDTAAMLERYRDLLPLRHVWHEDRGFRKTEILNKAVVASTSDYLIFTDQDCVPRRDFVAVHASQAERGHFISGGYFKLSLSLSLAITRGDVASGDAFSLAWLRQRGLGLGFRCTKLFHSPLYARALNAVTPARASWNGCNSSAWRDDILAVNGFNEEMRYGGEDREFGERLVNMGTRPLQRRYSAIVLHLDHDRPYVDPQAMARNDGIRRETRRKKVVWTPNGIAKP